MREFYQSIFALTNEKLLDDLCNKSEMRHLKKGEMIVSAGEMQEKLFFLNRGILRGYYFDEDGKEITDCFGIRRGTPVMPSDSLQDTLIAKINIVALTEAELIGLPVAVIMELLQQYPEVLKLYNKLLIMQTEEHWGAKQAICRYKAADLIQWFKRAYPGMIDVIPHTYIASFLGISPVHFSRERNRRQPDEKGDCAEDHKD